LAGKQVNTQVSSYVVISEEFELYRKVTNTTGLQQNREGIV